MTHREKNSQQPPGRDADMLPYIPRIDLWYSRQFQGRDPCPGSTGGERPTKISRAEGWGLMDRHSIDSPTSSLPEASPPPGHRGLCPERSMSSDSFFRPKIGRPRVKEERRADLRSNTTPPKDGEHLQGLQRGDEAGRGFHPLVEEHIIKKPEITGSWPVFSNNLDSPPPI